MTVIGHPMKVMRLMAYQSGYPAGQPPQEQPPGYQPPGYQPPGYQPEGSRVPSQEAAAGGQAVPEAGSGIPPDESATEQAPPGTPPRAGLNERGRVRRTRTGDMWAGIVISAVVLIALLIFIIQNSQSVTVHFLAWGAGLPLAVALLLSAIAGVLLLAIPGGLRILQLRRALRRNAKVPH